ncbi:MAG: glycosyltransferase family 2 protein, partial [Lewinella sp.]
MPPRFSIVIATRDRQELLERAVKSVIDQSYEDWELIVIDDCSSEPVNLGDLQIEGYKINIFRNLQNLGPGASRRKGMALAKGELLCFLDDDDYYLAGHLSGIIRWMEQNHYDSRLLVTGTVTVISGQGTKIQRVSTPGPKKLKEYWANPVNLLPFVIPRAIALNCLPSIIASPIEDFEWLCLLLLRYPCSSIDEYSAIYTV